MRFVSNLSAFLEGVVDLLVVVSSPLKGGAAVHDPCAAVVRHSQGNNSGQSGNGEGNEVNHVEEVLGFEVRVLSKVEK